MGFCLKQDSDCSIASNYGSCLKPVLRNGLYGLDDGHLCLFSVCDDACGGGDASSRGDQPHFQPLSD